MKLKLWCVSVDGAVCGYFVDYNEAFGYCNNLVDPVSSLVLVRVEVSVSEEEFVLDGGV